MGAIDTQPRTFSELVARFKQRGLAARIDSNSLLYPYFAGVPYPSWPLSVELRASDGGWDLMHHDHYSTRFLVRGGSELEVVARFLRETSEWVMTSDHVREAVAEWSRHCAEEDARQAELRRGTYVLTLPRDAPFHNLWQTQFRH